MGGGSVQLLLYEKTSHCNGFRLHPAEFIQVWAKRIWLFTAGSSTLRSESRAGSKRVPCPMEKGLVTIMNQKPALVILAAGMGSRFGGLNSSPLSAPAAR